MASGKIEKQIRKVTDWYEFSANSSLQKDVDLITIFPNKEILYASVTYAYYSDGVTDWDVKYALTGNIITIKPSVTSTSYHVLITAIVR